MSNESINKLELTTPLYYEEKTPIEDDFKWYANHNEFYDRFNETKYNDTKIIEKIIEEHNWWRWRIFTGCNQLNLKIDFFDVMFIFLLILIIIGIKIKMKLIDFFQIYDKVIKIHVYGGDDLWFCFSSSWKTSCCLFINYYCS